MQLFYNLTSPFARKVHMLALAAELPGLELVKTNPIADESLRAINPLGKIPALKDGDLVLIDSPLICEYIDDKVTAAGRPGFLQKNTPVYYHNQKIHALADGILDAAVATIMEKRRQDAEQSAYWLARWRTAITGALAVLEIARLGNPAEAHIGTIAVIAALGYLDFRLPDLNWRAERPDLAQWLAPFADLPWVRATQPHDG